MLNSVKTIDYISYYSRKCNVKSALMIKSKPFLAKGNISFVQNPKRSFGLASGCAQNYASQGERLRDYYNSRGIKFLLPSEIWSDSKISEVKNVLKKGIEKLTKTKKINKENLQALMLKAVPELKGRVRIKDFSDLQRDMIKKGYSKDFIYSILHISSGVADTDLAKPTNLYFRFNNADDLHSKAFFKKTLLHECIHCLESNFKNTDNMLTHKGRRYGLNQGSATCADNVFHQMEGKYLPSDFLAQKPLTEQNMLENYDFISLRELHKSFENSLQQIVAKEISRGDLPLGNSKRNWKHFYRSLQEYARAEKSAYQSNSVLRELYENQDIPVNYELEPMFYQEMENFYRGKVLDANKLHQ